MKLIKHPPLIIMCTVIIVMIFSSFSLTTVQAEEDAGMKTKAFNTSVVVGKDNTYQITETIKVDFIASSRGIIREIPLSNSIIRQDDGKTVEYTSNIRIKDVKVLHNGSDVKYDTRTESGNFFIQIGDEAIFIDGKQEYQIAYTMILPKDKSDQYDSVYLNVVPRGWGTSIKNTKINITFPSQVDLSQAEFIGEKDGNADTDVVNVTSSTEGDMLTITAKSKRPISYGEGLTFKLDLPEGYFEQPLFSGWQDMLFWILTIAIPLLCIIAWFVFGRDSKVITSVEFYPPDNMTSAQAGYLVDGKVQDKDLISMYLYWANAGLIEIEESAEDNFILHKKNDISPHADFYERKLFIGTFRHGDAVNIDSLDEDFGKDFYNAKDKLKSIYEKKDTNIYDSKSLASKKIGTVLSVVPIILYVAFFLYPLLGLESSLYALAPFFVIYGLLYGIIGFFKSLKRSKAGLITVVILVAVVALALTYISRVFNASPEITDELVSLASGGLSGLLAAFSSTALPCMAALLSGAVSLVFALLTRRKTGYYVQMLGKIRGFKEYIRTAELDKLNMLVKEDPKYFYNILPYAWVFGLTDEWVGKFESIKITNPDWYKSYRMDSYFTAMMMGNMIRSCNRNIQRQTDMYSPQDTGIGSGGSGGHGGGFSGGGGISGGGFGGGGGGRW